MLLELGNVVGQVVDDVEVEVVGGGGLKEKRMHVRDDKRIRSSIPTIRKVIENGGKAILMSHLGRPKGAPMAELGKGFEAEYSLEPVAARLAELLEQPALARRAKESLSLFGKAPGRK